MRRTLLLWALLSASAGDESPASLDDFLIVAAPQTKVERLTLLQLQRLYLGKLDRLDGQRLTPLQLRADDPARQRFQQALFGDRIDLEEHWIAQNLLAGADPPITVSSWSLLLIYVARNPGYIGYVAKAHADEAAARGLVTVKIGAR